MSTVLSEITQLSERDCFHVTERRKTEFTFPLHQHREFELNLVQNAAGAKRIVGDSIEEIGNLDLVLIGAENLEHVWEQGNCHSGDIREITIHFSPELFGDNLIEKNQFCSIKTMLKSARNGIVFPFETTIRVYNKFDNIGKQDVGFEQFLDFLSILHDLSKSDYRSLASSSFAHSEKIGESNRVTKVKEYIASHSSEQLTLPQIARMAGMSDSAFSRFFKLRTGKTFCSYISDIRLGNAARELVDSSRSISEICYACGFNNLSNFNRTFKARKGMTPKEFRELFKKKNVIV